MKGKGKKKRDKLNEENGQYIQKMQIYLSGRLNPFVYQDVIEAHRKKLFEAQEQGLSWQDIFEKDEEEHCKALVASCTQVGKIEKGLKWIEEQSIGVLVVLTMLYFLAFFRPDKVAIKNYIYLTGRQDDMIMTIICAEWVNLLNRIKGKMVFKEEDYDLVEILLIVAFIVGGPLIIIFCIVPIGEARFSLNLVCIAVILILLICGTRTGRLAIGKRKYERRQIL